MAIDWTNIWEQYKGLWVAFLDDERTVVGSGKTLREALDKAVAKGCEHPIVARMPEELTAYVGGTV